NPRPGTTAVRAIGCSVRGNAVRKSRHAVCGRAVLEARDAVRRRAVLEVRHAARGGPVHGPGTEAGPARAAAGLRVPRAAAAVTGAVRGPRTAGM
ncbi:hypothetical protein GA0115242_12061, partial [Streptomyces sp. SolWspMP-5a-2]